MEVLCSSNMSSSSLFGSFLFILSISTSFSLLHQVRTKSQTTLFSAPQSAYSITGVIIDQPASATGNHPMAITIVNDEILSHAIRHTQSAIYVYVYAPTTTTTTNKSSRQEALIYTSNVYSKLWDELVYLKKMHIQCYVASSSFVPSPTSFFKHASLQTLYGNKVNHSELITSLNTNSNIIIQDMSTFYQVTPSSSRTFYLDDVKEVIPVYSKVALGGSFDQLHNGHRKLLTLAIAYCKDILVIGITGDQMLSGKKHSDIILPYSQRKQAVVAFLAAITPSSSSTVEGQSLTPSLDIHELSEPYGPAIVDPGIEALVVSSETIAGAARINAIRAERGMNPVDVLVIRRTDASILSSTFIRKSLHKQQQKGMMG